eukprot:scaffold40345_cov51-Attheya_sp.AAC.3
MPSAIPSDLLSLKPSDSPSGTPSGSTSLVHSDVPSVDPSSRPSLSLRGSETCSSKASDLPS